ncbi:MAG: glycosyltransferase [Solirubrobacteraceae bacterium]|nr:glycosyltransferase [Solirubrobacteraceae bacterium]
MSAVRVARIISRLNIGGPAIQALTMTRLLGPLGYETLLIRGSEADHEGSMDALAEQLGVVPLRVPRMRRELGLRDLVAFAHLVRTLRRFRPDVVHTHAAKAGTLGRLAAIVPGPGRPRVIVHTFHGHSLSGYFSSPKAALFLRIERYLARRTTRLVAVSEEVRDDLVRLGVAPPEQIDVIRLGFDLSRFATDDAARTARRAELRARLGIPAQARVVTIIARLVPIKRVDRFLAMAERLADEPDVWFLIAGDGELRAALQAIELSPALATRVVWAGFQQDVPGVCFASDVVVLTSDNEGTPVSLIEAQAAGVPVVSTRVGGAATVVGDRPEALVAADDVAGLARAVRALLDDLGAAREAARAGADRVRAEFSLEALVRSLDELYRRELRR